MSLSSIASLEQKHCAVYNRAGDANGVPTPYPTFTQERRTDMAEHAYRIHGIGEVKGAAEGGVRYEIIVS